MVKLQVLVLNAKCNAGPTTLVADESLLPSLIPEIQNQNLTNVKGIMVVRQKSVHTGNQDAMFPQSQYALTSNKNYQWNSRGSGKLWEGLWFNIQYMTDEMAQRVLSRATSNDRKVSYSCMVPLYTVSSLACCASVSRYLDLKSFWGAFISIRCWGFCHAA